MDIKQRKKRATEIDIIYVIMAIWVFFMVYYKSMMDSFAELFGKTILVFRLILVLLAFANCIQNKQQKKKLFALIAFTLLVVADYLLADNWLIFELFFIPFYWGDKLNYKKVLRIFGLVTIISMAFVIIMNLLGLSPNEFVYIRPNGRHRMTLGFNHPNALSECLMVFLFCLYLLNCKGIKKHITRFIMIVAAIFVLVYPNTVNVAGTIILVLILDFLLSGIFRHLQTKRRKKIFFVNIIIVLSFVVILLYYIVVTKRFDDSKILNRFGTLFHRVVLSRQGLDRYGISLFGTYYESTTDIAIYVKKTATEYFTIDCIYFLLPIRYGLIATFVFFGFYLKSIYISIIKNNIELVSILLAVLIMGIVDPFITLFIMDFIFICAKCYKSDDSISTLSTKGNNNKEGVYSDVISK